MSAAQIRAQKSVLKKWYIVHIFCKYLNIKLNNSDFKNYILISLVQLNSNEELRKELIADFRSILEEYQQRE